jgi:hypothetical protein
LELTKLKRRFFEIKAARGRQRFKMTDIVPLDTHAWEKSFGNVDNANESIAVRGWGPLSYVLLDHPEVRKKFAIDSISHTGNSVFDVGAVNTSTGTAGDIMGKIMCVHLKDKSRMKTISKDTEDE